MTEPMFNAEGDTRNYWDNAAPGGPTPDYNDSRWLTANGEHLVHGLRVWDNDLRSGSVDLVRTFRNYKPDRPWDGWFYVLVDETDTHGLADGSRVTTVHPFTQAEPDPL